MQDQPQAIRDIQVIEVTQDEKGQFVPSGRMILLGDDCPIFLLAEWQSALVEGAVSVGPELFQDMLNILKSTKDD